jgi:hypothetical protein
LAHVERRPSSRHLETSSVAPSSRPQPALVEVVHRAVGDIVDRILEPKLDVGQEVSFVTLATRGNKAVRFPGRKSNA